MNTPENDNPWNDSQAEGWKKIPFPPAQEWPDPAPLELANLVCNMGLECDASVLSKALRFLAAASIARKQAVADEKAEKIWRKRLENTPDIRKPLDQLANSRNNETAMEWEEFKNLLNLEAIKINQRTVELMGIASTRKDRKVGGEGLFVAFLFHDLSEPPRPGEPWPEATPNDVEKKLAELKRGGVVDFRWILMRFRHWREKVRDENIESAAKTGAEALKKNRKPKAENTLTSADTGRLTRVAKRLVGKPAKMPPIAQRTQKNVIQKKSI